MYPYFLALALLNLLPITLYHCVLNAIVAYLGLVLLTYYKWNLHSFIPSGLRDSN